MRELTNSEQNNEQLEKLSQEYNALCYRLDVSSSDPAVRFDLELNLHATKPELVPSVDLRNKVKVSTQ